MNTSDEDHEVYELGWWPEIFGMAGVALLVWYLVTFARGSM
jgi:hypothetical protein